MKDRLFWHSLTSYFETPHKEHLNYGKKLLRPDHLACLKAARIEFYAAKGRLACISATRTLLFTGDLTDFETLHQIFVAREGRLLGQLAEAMGNRKGDMFDTWMKQQSDLVQATALAYGEREVLEASLRGLDDVSLPSKETERIVKRFKDHHLWLLYYSSHPLYHGREIQIRFKAFLASVSMKFIMKKHFVSHTLPDIQSIHIL